jgi:uncharacterized protein
MMNRKEVTVMTVLTQAGYDAGAAPRRRVTLDELRARRDEIYAIADKYGVSNVRVFGSVARGEADDDSDLDLLIDIDGGYFALSGFGLDVQDLLHVHTDVGTVNELKSRIRDQVLSEALPL